MAGVFERYPPGGNDVFSFLNQKIDLTARVTPAAHRHVHFHDNAFQYRFCGADIGDFNIFCNVFSSDTHRKYRKFHDTGGANRIRVSIIRAVGDENQTRRRHTV